VTMVSKALAAFTTVAASSAQASDPDFGPNDIPTVFFFSKSDDRNRVDYGLRLDASCQPVGDEPLFPYWREFEPPVDPPGSRTHSLKFFEYAAYGVSEQRIKKLEAKTEITVKLKAYPREIVITVEKGPDGKCVVTPRSVIAGSPNVELVSAYIKLKSGWSVEYVEVKGRRDGKGVAERLLP
jgi:hypothetical protein